MHSFVLKLVMIISKNKHLNINPCINLQYLCKSIQYIKADMSHIILDCQCISPPEFQWRIQVLAKGNRNTYKYYICMYIYIEARFCSFYGVCNGNIVLKDMTGSPREREGGGRPPSAPAP